MKKRRSISEFFSRKFMLFHLVAFLTLFYGFFFIFDPFNLNKIYFTIIHTDYLYGEVYPSLHLSGAFKNQYVGGSALISSVIQKIKAELEKKSSQVLLVDAGSSLFGGNSSIDHLESGKLVVDIMNYLGYDAMGLGNTELDYGLPSFKKVVKYAKFPILSANVIETKTFRSPPYLKPYIIKDYPRLRVGILGLSYMYMDQIGTPERLGELEFRPYKDFAAKYIRELKNLDVDMIVLLSDLWDVQLEKKLAAQFQDDLSIIVATSKLEERFDKAIWVGKVPIVKTPRREKSVGRFDFVLDFHSKSVLSGSWKLYPAASSLHDPDNNVIEIISTVKRDPAQLYLKRVFGEAVLEMPYETVVESAFGNLVCDILLDRLQADLVFINSPALMGLSEGEITYDSIMKALPYDNRLLTMNLTGLEVKEILEVSFERKNVVGILQVAGVRFQYNLSNRFGERVTDISIHGNPLDLDRLYKVATIEFLKNGGDGHKTFLRGQQLEYVPSTLRSLFLEYVQEKRKIEAHLDGRMTNVTPKESFSHQ
jgi:2',3'-cyclic-nucleotide 2'-phosphodiesterase/3'-nucleotidase